jgi:hypothetical protein
VGSRRDAIAAVCGRPGALAALVAGRSLSSAPEALAALVAGRSLSSAPEALAALVAGPKPEQLPSLRSFGRSHCGRWPRPGPVRWLSDAVGYEHRIFRQDREPVVHPFGISGIPPVRKEPGGVGEGQPAFDLVDLDREGYCLWRACLDSR